MNFLKSLLISLLTLVLFLSLTTFGTVFTLKNTLLDPDFVVRQVERLDVSALAQEVVRTQTGGDVPPEAAALEEALYRTIEEKEPWLKEQASSAVYAVYDFILGKTDRLSAVISLEPLREGVRENAWQAFSQDLPPEVSGLPPEQVEQYFDQFYQQFASAIPDEFEVNESLIPPEAMATILQVKQYVGYVQTAYIGLIFLMLALVLAIILLNRSVKEATRELGTTFLFAGVTQYAILWATSRYSPQLLPFADIPSSLQTWMMQMVDDLMAPLQTLSIGVMIAGAVLVIISFVYPRWREED